MYLEADPGGQPGTDLEVICNMPSCMSIYRFVRARISILVSKIIYCTWRSLEADLAGQPGTDLEVICNMLSCMSIYRFVSARISILVSKLIYCTWRSLEADLYLACLQDQRPATSRYNILFLTQELKSWH